MELTLTISDALTPALAKFSSEIQKTEIMEAAGLALMSITRRAFSEPALRPSPWPARKNPEPHALLKKSGTLWRSIRLANLSATGVSVTSDRIYAAIHQFGGTIRPKAAGGRLAFNVAGKRVFAKQVTIPARPFFPVTPGGQFTPDAERRITKAVELKLQSMASRL